MSKLALGTVQFGQDYGVTNNKGKISANEAEKILKFLEFNNIDTLDTAPSYGVSEKVLGMIGIENFNVISKTMPLELGVRNVIKSIYQSLNNLNISNLDGLLIHNINEVYDNKFDNLYQELIRLKQEKLINKIGFSTYTPDQVDFIIYNFDFDLIQVPFNVFDTRLIEGGQLSLLKNQNIEIHARSIFLQGLLLSFNELDNYFLKWIGEFDRYQEIVKGSNLTLLEYALNFALNIQEIDKVIVGVNSRKQLIEINDAILDQMNLQAFNINDEKLLNPSLWKI